LLQARGLTSVFAELETSITFIRMAMSRRLSQIILPIFLTTMGPGESAKAGMGTAVFGAPWTISASTTVPFLQQRFQLFTKKGAGRVAK